MFSSTYASAVSRLRAPEAQRKQLEAAQRLARQARSLVAAAPPKATRHAPSRHGPSTLLPRTSTPWGSVVTVWIRATVASWSGGSQRRSRAARQRHEVAVALLEPGPRRPSGNPAASPAPAQPDHQRQEQG
jgi:hypothetical protein